jgi:cyclic pyranopterin phosphate synthase
MLPPLFAEIPMISRVIPRVFKLVDHRSAGVPVPIYDRPADGVVRDKLGRPLRDLRISVTDRCNFRCVYCMPREVFGRDYAFLEHAELLTFEEIARTVRILRGHGIEKVRLTGGEPLLRRNIEALIEMLAAIPGLDLTLTTNGSLLKKKAQSLFDAGLKRISVSLDSLDDAIFKAMNDADFPVHKVLDGIDAASAAGLRPVKINMVVKRGVNEGSIVPMARHFRGSGHILRFIEFMDVGHTNGWRMENVVASAEVVEMVGAQFPLLAAEANYPGEVAARWKYADGAGEIGVVSSVTQAFCRDCTRLRLSTDGKLYTCLFGTQGRDLRAILRSDRDDEAISRFVAGVWQSRDDRYSEIRTAQTAGLEKVEMSYIGG